MWVISFWTNSDEVISFVFAGLQVSSGHTVSFTFSKWNIHFASDCISQKVFLWLQ